MLALAVMPVVIALAEKITLGMRERITAGDDLRLGYGLIPESATVTKRSRNIAVERGKPHKRETQIW